MVCGKKKVAGRKIEFPCQTTRGSTCLRECEVAWGNTIQVGFLPGVFLFSFLRIYVCYVLKLVQMFTLS